MGCDENVGAENAVSENAGPSSNAASLCCICTAKRTVTSSKGIGVILSWVFYEYAANKDILCLLTIYGHSVTVLIISAHSVVH